MLDRTIRQLKEYGTETSIAEAVQQLEKLRTSIREGNFSMETRKRSRYFSSSSRKMSSNELWTGAGPAPSYKAQRHGNPPAAPDASVPPTSGDSA